MESKTNYTLVGLFVLVFGLGLVLASFWLSEGFEPKHYTIYEVYMNEPVLGLNVQSPVRFNGVDVGVVKSIHLNFKDPRQVRLVLNVIDGTPITTSTTATLKSQGITGLTFISLVPGSKNRVLLEAAPGERYPVIPSSPSFLMQLDTVLKEVAENFQKVTDLINLILDKDNAIAIKNSLRSIEEVTAVLASHSKAMTSTLDNADILFKNTAQASKDLPEMVKRFNQSLLSFKTMGDQMGRAGKEVTLTMQAGRSALKEISEQALPPAISLIERLEQLATNVGELSKEIKRNPSMLVRGKETPRLGPGEK